MAFLAAIPALLSTMATTAAGTAAGSALSGLGTALSLGTSIGGTALSALGTMQSAKSQAEAMEANAEASARAAESLIESTKSDTYKLSKEGRKVIGAQVAGYGAAGVSQAGSPLEVMSQSIKDIERDILDTSWSGYLQQEQQISQANIQRYGAKQTRKAGYLGAGTKILTGLGSLGLAKGGWGWKSYGSSLWG